MTSYPVATEAMDQELYLLSALICGSEGLQAVENKLRGLAWVRSTFEASEVSRRIISIAVLLRSHLDSTGKRTDTEVGSLIPDSESLSDRKPLTLREACNKIIHANEIDIYDDPYNNEERMGALSKHASTLS